MLNLDDRTWEPFFIGDIFTVKRPKARSEKDYKDGKSPFVASGNFNNGVIRCCEPHTDEPLDKGNCITVSPVDGSAFYQQSDFLGRGGAGSSVLLLYCEHINKYSGLFIARLIRQTCSKYCYGKMGNQDGIKREKILLPITDDVQPDYEFMEQYIREREDNLRQNYITLVNAEISVPPVPLAEKKWGEFFICDIFSLESTASGIDGNKLSKEQGEIPYLTRTDLNNGYKAFVGKQSDKYKRDNGNCITIGLDTQTAFYQPHSFYTGQNVQVLKNDRLNKYNAKFFIPLLHNAMISLNWGGNGATLGRLKKKKIVVPITEEGSPDYEYMEQYIKAVMLKKYKKYLEYAQKKN